MVTTGRIAVCNFNVHHANESAFTFIYSKSKITHMSTLIAADVLSTLFRKQKQNMQTKKTKLSSSATAKPSACLRVKTGDIILSSLNLGSC
jgi:hypothetical protein